jgi:Lrp/AsnC family transcriptional regulator for asnA, asnC and gidA
MAGKILDEIDAAIIDLLQDDGRMSAVELASRLDGVTARVVRHRIKKLVRDGIISITAVVHPKALGYQIRADVFVESKSADHAETARKLAGLDLVTYVAFATGETDIRSAVVAKTVEDLHEMVQDLVHKIPSISRTRTFVLGPQLKFTHNWRVPAEVCSRSIRSACLSADGPEGES